MHIPVHSRAVQCDYSCINRFLVKPVMNECVSNWLRRERQFNKRHGYLFCGDTGVAVEDAAYAPPLLSIFVALSLNS